MAIISIITKTNLIMNNTQLFPFSLLQNKGKKPDYLTFQCVDIKT